MQEIAQSRAIIALIRHGHLGIIGRRMQVRTILRRGRRSLLIGLAFLIVCLISRELLPLPETPIDRILRESLLIVGWVAMWGPLDVFLYGWWPIAGRRRMFARLASIDVEVKPLK